LVLGDIPITNRTFLQAAKLSGDFQRCLGLTLNSTHHWLEFATGALHAGRDL
jgi:hypothetical protein